MTPAVDNDPNAMREHYWAAISNTSIHEAYPGHHLQLAVASRHPSLTRMLTDAPEFAEGWGMYSEQLMREQGFDAGPAFRVGMYTDADLAGVPDHPRRPDAPRRADARGGDRLPGRAHGLRGRERAGGGPALHVHAGYQLSYLLGKVLILGLREDEQRRRGDGFSLKAFHDTLMRNGSHADQLPPPPAREGGASGLTGEPVDVIPAIDVEARTLAGRLLAGASAGVGAPTDRPDRIAEQFVAQGARILHLVDFDGAQRAAPANLEAVGAVAARVAVPLQVAGGLEEPDHVRLAFAAGATRVVLPSRSSSGPMRSPAAWRSPATGSPSASTRGRTGSRPSPGGAARRPPSRPRRGAGSAGRPRLVLSHGGAEPDADSRHARPRHDADIVVAGGVADLDGGPAPARRRRRRGDPRRGADVRCHRLPAALEAAA